MVTGNPNTLGSFGELPEEYDPNTCSWKIEFTTTLRVIPGLENVGMEEIGTDDEGRPIFWAILENETSDIDYEHSEFERILKCLYKAGTAVLDIDNEFVSWYEEPEPGDW